MRKYLLLLACSLRLATSYAGAPKDYYIQSPDGSIKVHIEAGQQLRWAVEHKGQAVIAPSAISLQLGDGEVLGENVKVVSAPVEKVNSTITPINYKKAVIEDRYTQLTLNCKGDYSVIVRVYNDAVAYRFVTRKKGALIIKNEEANFNFVADDKAFIPIQWDYRDGKIFNSSFEALYHEINLSQFPTDSLAFLPILVDIGQGKKVAIVEADLEDYPGMYLNLNETQKGFKGVYAPYPLEAVMNRINYIQQKGGLYCSNDRHTQFPLAGDRDQ